MNDFLNERIFARSARQRPKLRQKMALTELQWEGLGPETKDLDVGRAPHLRARATTAPLG